MSRWTRIVLTALAALVGTTAVAGGAALVIGAAGSSTLGGAVPDRSFLGGSPFASYLAPGLVLAVVVGGTQLLAAVLVGRGSRSGPLLAAVAGFGLLIWIFVQMMFIPFSLLQAAYFAAGLAELGLVLLGLGLLRRDRVVTP
ncbi:hypothetical protein [Leifsonia shinshuensis]|uniref:DUF4345 domain-containing protein n=1 Tax=Leifsonia shinshuensis TaxID=150026 RepID=A0A7G6YES0_9MICO|nr:hypothetical protein [Leifsonia shinshuensis]QNE36985.1 hypothetical protein F1C12_18960 [Leifsonia shinshuensis]